MVMFKIFRDAVRLQFNEMMKGHQLYRTDVPKGLLWETYLESFPEGSNPIYRVRTVYDCQACKSFIRCAGSMVAVIDGKLVSIWDCKLSPAYSSYRVVAKKLADLVKDAPIKNVFLHDQVRVGLDKNYSDIVGDVVTWEHFYVDLPSHCVERRDRGSVYAEKQSQRDVFARALEEITFDALDTVVELIGQDSLYRGAEHLHTVQAFLKEKKLYDKIESHQQKDIFSWKQDIGSSVARIRNSAIGSLLVDLSKGEELNKAVRSFEAKVAPSNYQRPKALVTKAMVERARQAVDELGYTSALGRRFAVAEDIAVNNVLFANRDARRAMNADVFDEIASETRTSSKELKKVEEVSIDAFVGMFPKITSMELLFENRHVGNLVNLVAPMDSGALPLFKWNNNFSWTYKGDLADSIKERVKARGGSVSGDFRASLAWFNSDDLDLYLTEPSGNVISYKSKRSFLTGGELDVDMNVNVGGTNFSRNAVENITYPRKDKMLEGTYLLGVHNFTHREAIDVGFEVEIEFGGETYVFSYDREVRPKERIVVASFDYSHKKGIEFVKTLPRQSVQKEVWGIKTQVFHPVTMVMLSPNYWNGKPVGNKHWFFMLQDCKREGSSRGFFNEYLSDGLRDHRKVFEILGSKMRTEEEGEQLSGLGFSSTQRSDLYIKVSGAFSRTLNVRF
jgi:hypothetical protein